MYAFFSGDPRSPEKIEADTIFPRKINPSWCSMNKALQTIHIGIAVGKGKGMSRYLKPIGALGVAGAMFLAVAAVDAAPKGGGGGGGGGRSGGSSAGRGAPSAGRSAPSTGRSA